MSHGYGLVLQAVQLWQANRVCHAGGSRQATLPHQESTDTLSHSQQQCGNISDDPLGTGHGGTIHQPVCQLSSLCGRKPEGHTSTPTCNPSSQRWVESAARNKEGHWVAPSALYVLQPPQQRSSSLGCTTLGFIAAAVTETPQTQGLRCCCCCCEPLLHGTAEVHCNSSHTWCLPHLNTTPTAESPPESTGPSALPQGDRDVLHSPARSSTGLSREAPAPRTGQHDRLPCRCRAPAVQPLLVLVHCRSWWHHACHHACPAGAGPARRLHARQHPQQCCAAAGTARE